MRLPPLLRYATFIACLWCSAPADLRAAEPKTNVVFILADDKD